MGRETYRSVSSRPDDELARQRDVTFLGEHPEGEGRGERQRLERVHAALDEAILRAHGHRIAGPDPADEGGFRESLFDQVNGEGRNRRFRFVT